MPLLNIVVMLIVVGVGLYLINRFIPMASSIQIDSKCRGSRLVVLVGVVTIEGLSDFGGLNGLSSYRVR